MLTKISTQKAQQDLTRVLSNFVSIHGDNLELDSYNVLDNEDVLKELAQIQILAEEFYKHFNTCNSREEIDRKLQLLFVEKKFVKLGVQFKNQELLKQILLLDLENHASCLWLAMHLYNEFSVCLTRRSITEHFKDSFVLKA